MGIIKKECVICGKVEMLEYDNVNCCCDVSMFPHYDLDLLRSVGWRKHSHNPKNTGVDNARKR